jgi:superfamily II DNA or RNA helicase
MKDFLESYLNWLKEETLPGVWSKGVHASRSAKSIERTAVSPDQKELRFKMLTPERPLALEITLWIAEQDAHCNCGSKVEPCHHIVAVALAHANDTAVDPASAPPEDQAPRMDYHWIYSPPAGGSPGKLRFRRVLLEAGAEKSPPASLVSWVAGVRSGRLRGPLPSLTPADLALDEIYASETPEWPRVLKVLSDLPPLRLEGHPFWKTLEARAHPERPRLILSDAPRGGLVLESLSDPELETLQNGLWIRKGAVGFGSRSGSFPKRVIERGQLEDFLLRELPALRETHEILIQARTLPELVDREPELQLKVEPLSSGLFAVTARADYGPIGPGILVRDRAAEARIARLAREELQLILGEPKILPASGLVDLRLRRQNAPPAPELESALADFLRREAGVPVDFRMNEELLLNLLRMKEERPAERPRITALLQALTRPDPELSRHPVELRIPRELEPRLRDYQRRGCAWLQHTARTLGGAILADDMGLGKTLQTLAILEAPSLVVVPASLLHNWKQEARTFRPDLKVTIHHGPERVWPPNWPESAPETGPDLIVTTYSLLRAESDRFSSVHWRTVVLDEAHVIRNPETQAAVASTLLRADFRLALTGTPIQNRKRDLFSLFQFVAPGLFASEEDLSREVTAPFFLRRNKAEVLPELPPKTRLIHEVELTVEERQRYLTLFHAARSDLLSNPLPPLNMLEALLRSRQSCNHEGLLDPGQSRKTSSKLSGILALVDELVEAGHSILVYSQWTRFLDILQSHLQPLHPVFRLDGSTGDRGSVLQEFQGSDQPSVFLLSLHAGGVGLNLTRASHVIFCEPWWNPYVELQAEDRAYRMGQEKPVTIHRFIATNTLEEGLRALQARKLELGDEALQPADFEMLLK